MNYRGEYKVPGGKLVIVEFDVVDDRFTNLRITGDFFAFPEDALDVLAKSLQGLETTASAIDLQLCMNRAISADMELLGFGPIDVVAAIRRALA